MDADFGGAVDHFHVHIIHLENQGFAGMEIGRAHLLEDIISLVRYPKPFTIALTCTYLHPLFSHL